MTLFERIKSLATKKNKNMKKVALELGFSENLFYRWKTTEPKAKDLEKVADYFNVSVDYLLGRTESVEDNNDSQMAKKVMMRMNTEGLSDDDISEIEQEMERFFAWRIEEIKKERGEK